MVIYRWELPLASADNNNTGHIHGNAKIHLFNQETGFCKVLRTTSQRKAIKCPSCGQLSFLSWATGVEEHVDEHGCYFHAHDPFNIRKINQEFKDAFRSFTIRNKTRG